MASSGPTGPSSEVPRSPVFLDVPSGASASRSAAPPSEYWVVHGMYYRLPPLFDQLHTVRAEPVPGFHTYTQWAKSLRPQTHASSSRTSAPTSRGTLASLRQSAGPSQQGEDKGNDGDREDLEQWKRCYSTVVRRDIARQQKVLTTQTRETAASMKRTVTAAQKEVCKGTVGRRHHRSWAGVHSVALPCRYGAEPHGRSAWHQGAKSSCAARSSRATYSLRTR